MCPDPTTISQLAIKVYIFIYYLQVIHGQKGNKPEELSCSRGLQDGQTYKVMDSIHNTANNEKGTFYYNVILFSLREICKLQRNYFVPGS